MKRKRLDRDAWGFERFPYYQVRLDQGEFRGLACLLEIKSGDYCYWDLPKSGKTPVCGEGMIWLQLIPDHKSHVITAMYLPCDKEKEQAGDVSYQVSIWYADVTERIEIDADGVAVFVDKYLDVIFTPQGDLKVDDMDELEEAFQSGELTKEQFDHAIAEGDAIQKEYCTDISATIQYFNKILNDVRTKIAGGEVYTKPV